MSTDISGTSEPRLNRSTPVCTQLIFDKSGKQCGEGEMVVFSTNAGGTLGYP